MQAAALVEPFLTAGVSSGEIRVIAYYVKEGGGDVSNGLWVSSADYVEENGDVVERFRAALEEVMEVAATEDIPEEWFAILAEFTGLEQDVLEEITLQRFSTDIELDSVERTAELMVQEGLLDEVPDDLEELLAVE
jgi:ABC-type nitrate/sulfonate/bicarbonate transport system substrate-binding protein